MEYKGEQLYFDFFPEEARHERPQDDTESAAPQTN